MGLDGSITTVVEHMAEEQKKAEDARVAAEAKADPRFDEFGLRGLSRRTN